MSGAQGEALSIVIVARQGYQRLFGVQGIRSSGLLTIMVLNTEIEFWVERTDVIVLLLCDTQKISL